MDRTFDSVDVNDDVEDAEVQAHHMTSTNVNSSFGCSSKINFLRQTT
jgi:hypothetical protein